MALKRIELRLRRIWHDSFFSNDSLPLRARAKIALYGGVSQGKYAVRLRVVRKR